MDEELAERAALAAQQESFGRQLRAAWSSKDFAHELGLSDDDEKHGSSENDKPSTASSGTRSYCTESNNGRPGSGTGCVADEAAPAAEQACLVQQQLVQPPSTNANEAANSQLVGGYTAAAQQYIAAIQKASDSGHPSSIASAALRNGVQPSTSIEHAALWPDI